MRAMDIRKHMEVIGSCGELLGHVDRVDGISIKLTRDSGPDDHYHYIPMSWVERVDEHVHLGKNCREAVREWSAAPLVAAGG
jgi:hypothetical protein